MRIKNKRDIEIDYLYIKKTRSRDQLNYQQRRQQIYKEITQKVGKHFTPKCNPCLFWSPDFAISHWGESGKDASNSCISACEKGIKNLKELSMEKLRQEITYHIIPKILLKIESNYCYFLKT